MTDQEDNQSEPQSTSAQKLFGIPVEKYAKLIYFMVLIASAFALLGSLLGVIGIHLPGGLIMGTVGIAALVLALLALFVFEETFNTVDRSHFLFISIAYGFFFVVGMFLSAILSFLGFFGALVIFLFVAVQTAAFYAGYTIWGRGEQATRDSLTAEFMGYKSLILSKLGKAEKKAGEVAEKVKKSAEHVEETLEKIVEKKDPSDKGGVDKNA